MNMLKKLNSTSEMLVKASGTLDKRIAAHLINIAKHINGAGNGDVSAANYFFSLLTSTSGVRKDAIGNWLMAYAGCSWNADKKRFGRKKDFVFDEQMATENPWYKFTKQAEFKPFDLDRALKAILKKAHAALEDTDHVGEHKVNKDLLKKVESLFDPTPLPTSNETVNEGQSLPITEEPSTDGEASGETTLEMPSLEHEVA